METRTTLARGSRQGNYSRQMERHTQSGRCETAWGILEHKGPVELKPVQGLGAGKLVGNRQG